MAITILENCLIFDGVNEELIDGGSVVVEDDRIKEVSRSSAVSVEGTRVAHR